jgi:seryl-tRNA synthetase
MRVIAVIMILFFSACLIIGQTPSEEAKKDNEFVELMKKVKQTQEVNKVAIQAADKKTGEIITKTANQIVSLKAEVKQLKSELNEANKKLDSIDAPVSNIKFELLPVSSGKENW